VKTVDLKKVIGWWQCPTKNGFLVWQQEWWVPRFWGSLLCSNGWAQHRDNAYEDI